jgi:hypothetical protein
MVIYNPGIPKESLLGHMPDITSSLESQQSETSYAIFSRIFGDSAALRLFC